MKTIPLTIFTIFFILATSQGQLGKGKSVIKYLGTTFLMNDGCPAPRCNEKKSECARIRQMVRALYSHCLQSQVKFVINLNKTKKFMAMFMRLQFISKRIIFLTLQDGQHVGCVTDRIGDGSYLTIPVYATMCSAMCYETNPKYLNRIVRCPHPGERIHNAALANIIR